MVFATLSVAALCQVHPSVRMDELKVTPPQFAGIENVAAFLETREAQSLNKYVALHFQYPDTRNGRVYEGTELVQFVVSPTGEISDIQVINSLSRDIDAEVIRILRSTSGMWIPGTSGGKPTAMNSAVSLVIKTGGTEEDALKKDFQEMAQCSFKRAGKLWFDKCKPQRALKAYNRAMRYRPNDEGLLLMRGLCKYELGDKEGARVDWCRYRDCGGTVDFEGAFLTDHKDQMKGYQEVVDMLKTKK